ncbi:hypothetical protein E2C01_019669 [Portunus trituberculatus]|uniref:Uncharacterized protein n=1 Tax=Portunus trituberculatus TaxID=210409 RepID=A0A5B7E002_PORTR|nr:hypothetical protein [Portunus trituberculatus]
MCGVTGHCSAMRRPVEARIEVGGEGMQLPVYMADLEEPCLLGVNYLTKGRACIDFGKGTLRVYDTEVPLLPEDACPQVASARSAGLASGSRTWGEQQRRREMSGRGGQVESAGEVQWLPAGRATGSVATPAATSGRADVTGPDAGLVGSENGGAGTNGDEEAESGVGDSPPAATLAHPASADHHRDCRTIF